MLFKKERDEFNESNTPLLAIAIKAELVHKNLKISFCDNGRGIPVGSEESIFEAFL